MTHHRQKQRFKLHLCIGDQAVASYGMWLNTRPAGTIKISKWCDISDLQGVDRVSVSFGDEEMTFAMVAGADFEEEFCLAGASFCLNLSPRGLHNLLAKLTLYGRKDEIERRNQSSDKSAALIFREWREERAIRVASDYIHTLLATKRVVPCIALPKDWKWSVNDILVDAYFRVQASISSKADFNRAFLAEVLRLNHLRMAIPNLRVFADAGSSDVQIRSRPEPKFAHCYEHPLEPLGRYKPFRATIRITRGKELRPFVASCFAFSLTNAVKIRTIQEVHLCGLFERLGHSGELVRWLKPHADYFEIYHAEQDGWHPDFVVETQQAMYLCSVGELPIAAQAISAWCGAASAAAMVNGDKPWRWLAIPECVSLSGFDHVPSKWVFTAM